MGKNTPAEYFDLGSFQAWLFMDWSKGEVNVTALDSYLDSFASQLIDQGLKRVILSFAQVSDIPSIVKEDFSNLSPGDSLGMLEKNVGGNKINGQSVFDYMVDRFVSKGLFVGLAFGGINASDTDWDFGFTENDPTSLAQNLAGWAQFVKLDQIDFDVENAAFAKNDAQALAQFFESLHASMKDGPVTLTVMGDINYWGLDGSTFGPMFKYGKIQNMFDGLNLMLYNGQYYLNAGQTPTQSWDLYSWLKQIESNSGLSSKDSAVFLDIGFNAKINYNDKASSGGPLPYVTLPPDLASGQAAAYIYQQLEKSVQSLAKDTTLTFGSPFFWDSNADYTVSADNNYLSVFFKSTGNFEKDFFSYKK